MATPDPKEVGNLWIHSAAYNLMGRFESKGINNVTFLNRMWGGTVGKATSWNFCFFSSPEPTTAL
jgi:hypothetical protein